jgi:hypothetical protein
MTYLIKYGSIKLSLGDVLIILGIIGMALALAGKI